MPSTPRRAAIAVAAVLTAVTLVACSSGDGARNAVAVLGTFTRGFAFSAMSLPSAQPPQPPMVTFTVALA